MLDGEAIALQPDGRPHPFQVTGSRFGSRTSVDTLRREIPLTPFIFDILHADGEDLLDQPAEQRGRRLAAIVPESMRVPRMVVGSAEQAAAFQADTLARGHEGVLVKSLDAPYAAGRRGAGWIKVKPRLTLDLVVLAAEWGHGRRQGWLSNLHLGARADDGSGFVMLGKTFKGLTDATLAWQTERLLELETARHGITVRCTRSWWWRSHSTACSAAHVTRAASRCGSRGCCDTVTTSGPTRPTRWPRCWPMGGF